MLIHGEGTLLIWFLSPKCSCYWVLPHPNQWPNSALLILFLSDSEASRLVVGGYFV